MGILRGVGCCRALTYLECRRWPVPRDVASDDCWRELVNRKVGNGRSKPERGCAVLHHKLANNGSPPIGRLECSIIQRASIVEPVTSPS